jgi:hypothetical protein
MLPGSNVLVVEESPGWPRSWFLGFRTGLAYLRHQKATSISGFSALRFEPPGAWTVQRALIDVVQRIDDVRRGRGSGTSDLHSVPLGTAREEPRRPPYCTVLHNNSAAFCAEGAEDDDIAAPIGSSSMSPFEACRAATTQSTVVLDQA